MKKIFLKFLVGIVVVVFVVLCMVLVLKYKMVVVDVFFVMEFIKECVFFE